MGQATKLANVETVSENAQTANTEMEGQKDSISHKETTKEGKIDSDDGPNNRSE
ncbi:hypothetical protein JMUB7504_27160 [Staphylococcus aureus]